MTDVFRKDQWWRCPNCGKVHSKRHWRDSRQLFGQKKWDNWEGKTDACRDSNPHYEIDPVTRVPRPNFCPHCGWEEQITLLVRLKA